MNNEFDTNTVMTNVLYEGERVPDSQ